jgi:uncharacterized protein (TIGR03437 family)
VQSISSYFKFNLDYMSLYNLIQLQNNGDNRSAYQMVRDYTASHQNAFFNMVDRALAGPNAARDTETLTLLDQWLERPRRDFYVDLSKTVPVCGAEACSTVPVPLRPPADFIWQVNPFQLSGGLRGLIENAGIDYILPYWMGRYYGVVDDHNLHSAASPESGLAPDALASLFGANLASTVAQTVFQPPPPTTLGGATLVVTDAAGTPRNAPLLYVSPGQINFMLPDGSVPGTAQFALANGSTTQNFTAIIDRVAPGLFSMNGAGTGVAAATAFAAQVPDTQLRSPVPVFQCAANGCVSTPILLGVDTETYVTFYGTGIRGRSALSNVVVTINGVSVPVLYAGPTPGFAGLDQVNVMLMNALRGSGEANVVLSVDGRTSNAVSINIQ